jgi:hypothetical protein
MPNSRFLIPISLVLVVGCAKPRFTHDVEAGFRPGAYQTVAVDPRRDRILIRDGMRPLNPDLHLKAVLAELDSRSYRPAPAAEADLWIAVYVLMGAQEGNHGGASSPAHREGSGEGHHGGRSGAGTGATPAGGEAGPRGTFTIIVQLEDPKTGLPVWQGEANLDHQAKALDGNPLSIEEAVHELMRPLPARP